MKTFEDFCAIILRGIDGGSATVYEDIDDLNEECGTDYDYNDVLAAINVNCCDMCGNHYAEGDMSYEENRHGMNLCARCYDQDVEEAELDGDDDDDY